MEEGLINLFIGMVGVFVFLFAAGSLSVVTPTVYEAFTVGILGFLVSIKIFEGARKDAED